MNELSLDRTKIPQHIAIIMDGNGRWAAEKGQPRRYGHQAGVDAVKKIAAEATRLGVKYLTLYTFSTENWNRPADEISALMGLVLTSLEDEIFMKNNVRFRVMGELSRLPEDTSRDRGAHKAQRHHDDGGGIELQFALGNHASCAKNRSRTAGSTARRPA